MTVYNCVLFASIIYDGISINKLTADMTKMLLYHLKEGEEKRENNKTHNK